MGRSILTRHAAAFEAANVAKGITPSRSIRTELIQKAQEKEKTSARNKAYREKLDKKYWLLYGCSRAEYNQRRRDAQWKELIGDEPVFDSDKLEWDKEVQEAEALLLRHGEEDQLPEENSGYFTYWMRYELLHMRGSASQHMAARNWSMVDYMEDVRIRNGRWEFSVIQHIIPNLITGQHNRRLEFFEYFDTEVLTEREKRVWFPFGVVATDQFRKFVKLPNDNRKPIHFVKRRKHPKNVVALFNLHRLGTVKRGIPFTNLHRKLSENAKRDNRDKMEANKQAKLNSLWK